MHSPSPILTCRTKDMILYPVNLIPAGERSDSVRENKEHEMARLISTYYIDEEYSRRHARLLHTHDDVLELFYVFQGEGWYQTGTQWHHLQTGSMVICNSGTLHGESPFQTNEMRSYCIALTDVEKPGLPPNHLVSDKESTLIDFNTARDTVHHLMQTVHQMFSERNRDERLCQSLAQSVLLLTEHELQLRKQDSGDLDKSELLLTQITDYLNRNYRRPVRLEEISGELHISVSHLSHLFKNRTGMSPMQYVIYRRIGSAQTLLMDSDLPIHEIEEQLGFGSSCHLTSMFKKYVGVSPKEYRQYFQQHEIK